VNARFGGGSTRVPRVVSGVAPETSLTDCQCDYPLAVGRFTSSGATPELTRETRGLPLTMGGVARVVVPAIP
jgi:hypothetical protein